MTSLVKALAPSCCLSLCIKKCNRTQGLLYDKSSTKKRCYIVALHHIFSKEPCHTNYCASSVNPCSSPLTAKPIMTKKTQVLKPSFFLPPPTLLEESGKKQNDRRRPSAQAGKSHQSCFVSLSAPIISLCLEVWLYTPSHIDSPLYHGQIKRTVSKPFRH